MFQRLFKKKPPQAPSYAEPAPVPTYSLSLAGGGSYDSARVFKEFKSAATEGDISRGLQCLKADASVMNKTDRFGRTALVHATMWQRNDFVDMLLKQPSLDLAHQCRSDGNCAIHLAAFNGNFELVKMLAAGDPETLVVDGEFGLVPAARAYNAGHQAIGEWLVAFERATAGKRKKLAVQPSHISKASSVAFTSDGDVKLTGTRAGVASEQLQALVRDKKNGRPSADRARVRF